jgi:pimeloyl-ACP methyl ester carboxylesterase
MKQAEERQFALPGLTLAARFWPGEGVPILALHGFLDNANSFVPLVEHLPNPVLALDFAGHGRSDHRPLGTRQMFINHVEDSYLLIDQLGWDDMILLGHSMGAGVAGMLAASGISSLRQLLLIDGLGAMTIPAKTTASHFASALKKRLEPRRPKPVYPDIDTAANARTNGFGGLSFEASRLLCERGLEPCDGGLTWSTDAMLRLPTLVYMEESQMQSLLHHIRVPSLLIKAKQGMGGKGVMDHRIDHVRDLKVVDMEGRHHLHMERAAEVATVLVDFLAAH